VLLLSQIHLICGYSFSLIRKVSTPFFYHYWLFEEVSWGDVVADWVMTSLLWHLTTRSTRTRRRGRRRTFTPDSWRAPCRTCCTPSLASSTTNQTPRRRWRHAVMRHRRRRRCYWRSTTRAVSVDVLRQHAPPPSSSPSTALVISTFSTSRQSLVGYKYKTLSCRRETVRCFVLLDISLSYSRKWHTFE